MENDPATAAQRLRSNALALTLLLASSFLTVRFVLNHAYSMYDDAYIYLTYAENFAHGCGLTFRCDGSAPVEGFTSPLYMALLVLARIFTSDLETTALLIGMLGTLLAFWFSALTAAHAFPRTYTAWLAACSVLAVLALDHYVLLNSVIGLETALFSAAVAGTFWAAVTDRPKCLSVGLSIAMWTRPEGALLLALPLLTPSWRAKGLWATPIIALAALIIARLAYYGDLLPNTYYAKSGGTPEHAALGARYIGDILVSYPAILVSPLALRSATFRGVTLGLLVGAAVVLASFIRSGGDLFLYGRLFVPFVPSLVACTAMGLGGLGRGLGPTAQSLLFAPLFVIGLWVAHGHALAPGHGFSNVLRWKEVGRFLCRNHAGARVATVPIGAISYFSGLPIIDLVGLTSVEVARAGHALPPDRLTREWIGHERHNTPWVLAQRPTLIVLGAKFGAHPVRDVRAMRAGFYAEWQLLTLAKTRQIPYEPYSPEVVPGVYWHMLRSTESQRASDASAPCR